MTFKTYDAANEHAQECHGDRNISSESDFPCPFAEQEGCLEVFITKAAAKCHAKKTHRKNYKKDEDDGDDEETSKARKGCAYETIDALPIRRVDWQQKQVQR
jgi:hypothetical protein